MMTAVTEFIRSQKQMLRPVEACLMLVVLLAVGLVLWLSMQLAEAAVVHHSQVVMDKMQTMQADAVDSWPLDVSGSLG